ncbi:unnamed protein product [Rhizoctonia solani]|uniref:AMP-dependent synthetase/ligase domain-containing protein n=1 Tax=Rhizoctonia solani TaxID=456999 RepID=A0A8H2X9F0_9AGAM|nr:unnamed protein product [Rhizoctonia solani]CAE6417791.1 unnamed protein product [Rhizoctonia solani]
MTPSSPVPYAGPSDNDPLTDDELAILLAIPRAAETTPNTTLFRLPLGPDPSTGWIDATCAETHSIVARLADVWKSKLFDLLCDPDQPVTNSSFGPGTTICIATQPDFYGVFHILAFWALGCTVQCVPMKDPISAIDQLNESGCKMLLCSEFDDGWIEARKAQFKGVVVQLPKGEQALELVRLEKQGQADAPPPWPAVRRPTPLLILQSSGTTGRPKLLRSSLYCFAVRVAAYRQTNVLSARPDQIAKNAYTHPRLVLVPFYWSSVYFFMLTHLATSTPMAFAYVMDIYQLPPSRLIDWAIALDVGAIATSTGIIRLIPEATYRAHAKFIQSLYSFNFGGSAFGNALSQLFEELKFPATNMYGSSELGTILVTSKPPYTHLRPYRGIPPPLVHPISEYGPDGSRYVELWFTPTMSPLLAHHLAHSSNPVKLEPFPGDGPHKGELAFNLDDIFQELTISNESELKSETVYIHLGRHTDEVRLGEGGFGSVNGALYEATIGHEINTRISRSGGSPWTLDSVQLFGNNMSRTALVIQLRLDQDLTGSYGSNPLKGPPIHEIYESVEETNNLLGLTGCERVHTGKRTLVVSSDGTLLHGPGSERLAGSLFSLSMTHKRTLKRWENVCKFKPWLDGLDFSDA